MHELSEEEKTALEKFAAWISTTKAFGSKRMIIDKPLSKAAMQEAERIAAPFGAFIHYAELLKGTVATYIPGLSAANMAEYRKNNPA
jgi:hypothetical protein